MRAVFGAEARYEACVAASVLIKGEGRGQRSCSGDNRRGHKIGREVKVTDQGGSGR